MGEKRAAPQIVILLAGLVWPVVACGAEANLMGWWKFDGNGLDSSGNGRDGSLVRDAHYEAGYAGQALALDGDGDCFTVDGYRGILSADPVTVAAWVNTTGDGTMVYWGRNAGRRRVDFRISAGRLRVEHGSGNLQGDTSLNDGEWHHVALTMPPLAPVSNPPVKLYLDGQDDTRDTQDPEGDFFELVDHSANVDLTFGCRVPNGDRYFPGLMDEVRMYDRELTASEIEDLMVYGHLARASSPSIPDGGKFEDPWTNLEWAPGPLATYHNVYFGTSFEDVNAGAENAFVGKVVDNSQLVGLSGFPAPEGLKTGITYYWRVDAVNESNPDSPWRGQVWSFWIPELNAYHPVPADDEPFENTNVVLSWAPGLRAIFGTVYFGTDANQVASATGGLPMMETTYDPGPLEPATIYYWRADTFNGTDWVKGNVWSFKTMPEIPLAADPNLILQYQFDEGKGTTLVDWSGHGNHGKLVGTQWTNPGWLSDGDGALTFADGGYVAIDQLNYSGPGRTEVTVCAWIRTTDPNDQYIVSFDRNEYYRLQINGEVATAGQVGWHVMTMDGATETQVDYGSLTRVDDGLWHHVCGVFDHGTSTIFIDGQPEPSATGGVTYGIGDLVRYGFLGANSEATSFNGARGAGSGITGDLSEVRIYDKALTQEEVLEAMRGDPRMAWDLQPTSGRILQVGTVTRVTWRPGDGASQHDVYFGTDVDAVRTADAADTTGVYRGRQSGATNTPAEGLAWGQTYHWRIDEVGNDGTVTRGRVQTFSVADYITIEDFEGYLNVEGSAIFDTWIDGWTNGTGAVVGNLVAPFAERENTYDGGWAMPLDYNNINAPWYSEAERTWETAQNWTGNGVDTLTLYYTAGPLVDVAVQGLSALYVGVADGAGRTAVFVNSNPEAVWQTEWQRWDVPLADISAAGVNPKAIKKIFLGVGDRDKPQPGGAGRIYIDAIRLTIAPVPQ
jgi:hypothetical protein